MYGMIANVLSDRVLRTGAKVWINYCNGDASCPIVIGLSKSGRMVQKYTHYKRLTNFRAAWIPEHMRERVAWQWETKAEAAGVSARYVEMWAGVRYFNRDSTQLMRDGITEGEAFERARHRSNGEVRGASRPAGEASASTVVLERTEKDK